MESVSRISIGWKREAVGLSSLSPVTVCSGQSSVYDQTVTHSVSTIAMAIPTTSSPTMNEIGTSPMPML